MPDARIREWLRATPLAGELTEALLEQLVAISEVRSYKPKERVASRDEPVRGIHVLGSGTVLLELSVGKDRVAHKLHAPQSFGELPTLRQYPVYGFDATATEYGTELIEIAAEPFRELFASEPDLPALLVGTLSDKLLSLVERVEELSITCATTRLARHLVSRPRRDVDGTPEVDLGVDRKDLAAILAITPEHLSRLLKRWADAGLVRPLGRTLALLNPQLLATMADLDEAPEGGG